MGNVESSSSNNNQQQPLPPYAAQTGVAEVAAFPPAAASASAGSKGKFGNQGSAATSSCSGYVAIDEESGNRADAPVPIAVAVAVSSPEDASPPPMNPSYQQQQQQQAPAQSSSGLLSVFAPSQQQQQGAVLVPQSVATSAPSRQQQVQQVQTQPQQQILFLRRSPTVIEMCPVCQARNVRTRTRTAPNWVTWLSALALFVAFWPLCWLPLVVDSSKRTEHYCPSCNNHVATIEPYQDCCVKHRGSRGFSFFGNRSGRTR